MANRGYSNGVGWLKSDDPKIDTGKKQLAWYWKEKISAYIDQVDCLISVDKFDDCFSSWYKMIGFLDLKYTDPKTFDYIRSIRFNTAKRGAMPNWEKWPDSDKQDVIDVIGQDFLKELDRKIL